MNTNLIKYIALVVSSVILMLTGYWYVNSQNEQWAKNFQNLNSELKSQRLKDSTLLYESNNLVNISLKDFIKMKSADTTIRQLQKLVESYKKDLDRSNNALVTLLKSKSFVQTVTETEIVVDTFNQYPTYKTKIDKNGWIQGTIIATKDSFTTDLLVKNEYEMYIGYKKPGFFKKPELVTELKNKNPYSEVNALKTFQKTDLKSVNRLGLGVHIGYGIHSYQGLIRASPIIGIGLNYNIISIK